MTTIAASFAHKQIAADSRCDADNAHFELNKLRELPSGSIIGAAGDLGLILKLYNFVLEGGDKVGKKAEIEAIQLSHAGLLLFDTRTSSWYSIKNKYFAIGSGSAYAMGAMAKGASPQEAVEIASNFDSGTGCPIDVMTLKRRKNVNSA